MSLINNALKKAQRQRSEADASRDGGSSHDRSMRRHQGMSMQTLLLIALGACTVIALSVVTTIYLLKPAPEASSPPRDAPLPPSQTQETSPVPTLVETVPPPIVVTKPPPAAIATSQPEPEPDITTPNSPPPEITVPSSETDKTAAPAPPVKSAQKLIYEFIDQLQVMGIRSSGSKSKVLMNNRVYEINDLVDRSLGLRLIKVSSDRLTFSDQAGNRYIKDF